MKGIEFGVNKLLFSSREQIGLFIWIFSAILFDFFNVFFSIEFAKIFVFFGFLGYLLIIYGKKTMFFNRVYISFIYISIHLYYLSLSLLSETFLSSLMDNGDASGYHYPVTLALSLEWDIIEHFSFNNFAHETGRLTQLIYAMIFSFWREVFDDDLISFQYMAFVVNSITIFVAGYTSSKIVVAETGQFKMGDLSFFLVLCSPFILAWSFMPMKESMLVLLSVFLMREYFRGSILGLILVSFLIFIERYYYLYLVSLVFIISPRFSTLTKTISLLAMLPFLLIFSSTDIGQKIYDFGMWINQYTANNIESGISSMGSDAFSSFLRVIFSPNPLSIIYSDNVKNNYFYLQHFIITSIYLIMLTYIIRHDRRIFLFIFLFYLFNFIVMPESTRQKITFMIPFIALLYPITLARKYKI